MKGERKIFGGDKEAIRRYQAGVISFNKQLLQKLRQELAECRADIEAEQDNPQAQHYHAAEALILECQIKSVLETLATITQPPKPRRIIVNSRPPRRPRKA